MQKQSDHFFLLTNVLIAPCFSSVGRSMDKHRGRSVRRVRAVCICVSVLVDQDSNNFCMVCYKQYIKNYYNNTIFKTCVGECKLVQLIICDLEL